MRRPLHPILFALLPALSSLSTNIEGLAVRHAVRPALVLLIATATLWIGLRQLLGSWKQAALISSVAVSILSVYGYLHTLAINLVSTWIDRPVAAHLVLAPASLAFILLVAWLVRQNADGTPTMTGVMNAIAVAALLYPAFRIVDFELRGVDAWPAAAGPMPSERVVSGGPGTERPPDIYYVILDGYGRADVLEEYFGFDNQAFLEFLTGAGFYVGEASHSNYGVTHLSVASTLNMDYLNDLAAAMGVESTDHRPISHLILDSLVVRALRSSGYEIVATETGYRRTELTGADLFFRRPSARVSPFEALMIEESFLRAVLDLAAEFGFERWYPGYSSHAGLVRFSLEKLGDAADLPGPKFVFVHVFAPHPPFVFDRDGNSPAQTGSYSTHDGNQFGGSVKEYREGYVDQVQYLNRVLMTVVEDILARSELQPIIILQGDHGSGLMTNWDAPAETDLRERMSILNAVLLPAKARSALYPEISPVNTFRLIFDSLFGTNLGLLPDRSYFSSWRWPYDFIELEYRP